MPDKKNKDKAIAKRGQKGLAKSEKKFTVASLEKAMLKEFPRKDAEDWDVMGLTVGEGALPVSSVAVALDPTVEAIRKAAVLGADVLVTHHPPFLEGPKSFSPERSVALSPGAGVWAAIRGGVALMNFHTALDVSRRAQAALPQMAWLQAHRAPCRDHRVVEAQGLRADMPGPRSRRQAREPGARRCQVRFRVWQGAEGLRATSTALCGWPSAPWEARRTWPMVRLLSGRTCSSGGEVKYHDALELSQAGLAIIELGHDVSELPLAAVLAKTLADVGVKPTRSR